MTTHEGGLASSQILDGRRFLTRTLWQTSCACGEFISPPSYFRAIARAHYLIHCRRSGAHT